MSSNAIGQRPKERTARTPKTKNRTHPRLEKFVKDFLVNPAPPPTTTDQPDLDIRCPINSPKDAIPGMSQAGHNEDNLLDSISSGGIPPPVVVGVKNSYSTDCQKTSDSNLIDNTTNNSDKLLPTNSGEYQHNKDEATTGGDAQTAPSSSCTDTTKPNARPVSPLSNQCPICLANIITKDTSFTNTCFHSFCYSCIDEWTKIKTQCPVCRTDFTKIIYNVKSETVYDEKLARSTRRSDQALFSSRTFLDSFHIGLTQQDHHGAIGNSYNYSVQQIANGLGLNETTLLHQMLDYDSRAHPRSRNDRYSVMYAPNHPTSSGSVPAGHSTSSRVNASTNTPAASSSETRRRHGSRMVRTRTHSNTANQESRSDNVHVARDPRLDNHNYAQLAFNRHIHQRIAVLEDNYTMSGMVPSDPPRFRHCHTRHMPTPGFRPSQTQTNTSSSNSTVRRSTRSRSRAQVPQQHICTPTEILNNRQSNPHFGDTGEAGINNLLVQHSSLYTDRYNESLYQLDPPYNQRNPLLTNPILLSQLTETIPQDVANRVGPTPSSSRPSRIHESAAHYSNASPSMSGNPSASLFSMMLHPSYNRNSSYLQGPTDFSTPPPLEDISISQNIPPIVPPHRTAPQAAPPPPLLESQDHQLSSAPSSADTALHNQARINHRMRPSIYSPTSNFSPIYQQSASPPFSQFPTENWFLAMNGSPQSFSPPALPLNSSRLDEPHPVRAHDNQGGSERSNPIRPCSLWSGPPRIVSNRYRSNKRYRTSVACRPIEFINLSGSEDEDDSNRGHVRQNRNEASCNATAGISYVQLDNPQPGTSGTQTNNTRNNEKRNSKRRKTATTASKGGSSSKMQLQVEISSNNFCSSETIGSRLSSPENDCDNEPQSHNHHHYLIKNSTSARIMNGNNSDDSSEVEIVDCLKPIPERDHDVIDLEND